MSVARRPRRLVPAVGLMALASLMMGGGALAHGFNLGFVAPFSGERAQDGRDALDGLLVATRERDSHPDEHSDGHLGGLDSYIFTIDSAAGDLAGQIARAVAEHSLDVLTVAGPKEMIDDVRGAIGQTGAVFCPPGRGPVHASLEGEEAARLASAYAERFGRKATPSAVQGYNAGRAVDRAVRALGGVDDPAALRTHCDAN